MLFRGLFMLGRVALLYRILNRDDKEFVVGIGEESKWVVWCDIGLLIQI